MYHSQQSAKAENKDISSLKLYKFAVVPALLHGCEAWTPTGKYHSRIQTAEMKFYNLL
jgi:hypothetical protein